MLATLLLGLASIFGGYCIFWVLPFQHSFRPFQRYFGCKSYEGLHTTYLLWNAIVAPLLVLLLAFEIDERGWNETTRYLLLFEIGYALGLVHFFSKPKRHWVQAKLPE